VVFSFASFARCEAEYPKWAVLWLGKVIAICNEKVRMPLMVRFSKE
jgi:hypothetical protein